MTTNPNQTTDALSGWQPEKLTFEQFAARHGASRQDVGDAGNHRRGERHSDKTWQRALSVQRQKDEIWQARRDGLRAAYASAVKAGDIVAPTAFDRHYATAAGHPDRVDTQAARRLLAKHWGVPAEHWDHENLSTPPGADA